MKTLAGQFESLVFLSQTQKLELQQALRQPGRPSSKAQAERPFLPVITASEVDERSEAERELVFLRM